MGVGGGYFFSSCIFRIGGFWMNVLFNQHQVVRAAQFPVGLWGDRGWGQGMEGGKRNRGRIGMEGGNRKTF